MSKNANMHNAHKYRLLHVGIPSTIFDSTQRSKSFPEKRDYLKQDLGRA